MDTTVQNNLEDSNNPSQNTSSLVKEVSSMVSTDSVTDCNNNDCNKAVDEQTLFQYGASLTFINTEDCQLRCKYCYLCKRSNPEVMTVLTAQQAIEFALANPDLFPREAITLGFIGGEPFLEMEQIESILAYFRKRTKELNHPWHDHLKLYITTNGVNYHTPKVQKFIAENLSCLDLHYSHDGPQEKHDLQRVFANGKGSWSIVDKNLPMWHKDFPNSSPNTMISHAVLPYVFDTCRYFWDRGFRAVSMGLIFDPGWEKGDDALLEKQMIKIADYLIENNLYNQYICALFDRNIGFWIDPQEDNRNGCNVTHSWAVTPKNEILMCSRFATYTLDKKPTRLLGKVDGELNRNHFRPFKTLNRTVQSPQKCLDCEVGSGCTWCQGCNYENAQTDTIFERTTHICQMHKARVRANNYFWNKIDRLSPPVSTDERVKRLFAPDRRGLQYLYVILDSHVPSFCHFPNDRIDEPKSEGTVQVTSIEHETMSIDTLQKVVYYALTNNLVLNIPLGYQPLSNEVLEILKPCRYLLVRPADAPRQDYPDSQGVLDVWNPAKGDLSEEMTGATLILRTSRAFLSQLPSWFERNSLHYDRFSLVLTDVEQLNESDLQLYGEALERIASWLPDREEVQSLQLAFMTDLLTLDKPGHCNAGVKHLTIAPDGSFYVCPGFYFSKRAPGSYLDPVTNIDKVLETHEIKIPNGELFQLDHAPICQKCDAYHCSRCVWLNKQTTLEINTPSHQQCVQSHLERNASRQFGQLLGADDDMREIPEISWLDPYEEFFK